MGKKVIERAAAEAELAGILEHFEADDGIAAEDRARLLAAIERGRVVLDEDKGEVMLQLVAPVELENGQQVKDLTFREPTAGDLKVVDKYKEGENMARALHLASKMTGQPLGVLERIGARDLMVLAAVVGLFF